MHPRLRYEINIFDTSFRKVHVHGENQRLSLLKDGDSNYNSGSRQNIIETIKGLIQ